MRARVTFTQLNPQLFAEVVETYRESTLPAARQSAGNRGVLLLTDKSLGKGIAISLWDSPADLEASETGYYQEQLTKFLPFFTVPPVREEFDVILDE